MSQVFWAAASRVCLILTGAFAWIVMNPSPGSGVVPGLPQLPRYLVQAAPSSIPFLCLTQGGIILNHVCKTLPP